MALAPANTSRFEFELSGTSLLVSGFSVNEQISNLYQADLRLAVEQKIESNDAVGQTAVLTIQSDDMDRYIHGMIRSWERIGSRGRFHVYRAKLVPRIWELTRQQDCRIFQNLNTPQIVKQILSKNNITADLFAFRLKENYALREYCVQYRETNFAFIARLLAEEGIFYFFEHSRDNHIIVFGDSTVNYQPISGNAKVLFNSKSQMVAEEETVIELSVRHCIQSGTYSHTDYNFQKPDLNLQTTDSSDTHQDLEIYDYPGRFTDQETGRRLAQMRLEQTRMPCKTAVCKSTSPRMLPGFTFELHGHHVLSHNQQYLLTQVQHQGSQPQVFGELAATDTGFSYINTLHAVPATVTIRPPHLDKPVINSTQTAIVTGPSGEEIYTDKYGRVKVQFHWDRIAQHDENTTCWIRVAQFWAGPGWGAMFIPRIGQEVVIAFFEGNPDRPLIIGRFYHGTNMPPYDLPAEKTRSTIKTNSSKGGQGCNEIRFEDLKGQEELFVQAEKDQHLHIKNDSKMFVGQDRHITTKQDDFIKIEQDRHQQTGQDIKTSIGRDHHLTVQGNQAVQINGSQSLAVAGNSAQQYAKSYYNQVADAYYLKATKVVIQGKSGATFKMSGNFVSVNTAGVTIKGAMVMINSGGSPGTGQTIAATVPLAPLVAQAVDSVTADMSDHEAAAHNAPTYQEQDDQKDWIELKVTDESNNPLPYQPYRIILPDGTTVSQGVTDDKGFVRVNHIDAGNCKIIVQDEEKKGLKNNKDAANNDTAETAAVSTQASKNEDNKDDEDEKEEFEFSM